MYFVGVDGGGSGCRVGLADGAGRMLGTATGGPANIATDREGALSRMLSAIAEAVAASGLDIGEDRIAAVLGVAGANVSEHADWVRARLPFARSDVVSDVRTALAGAHGGRDGVVAAIGTGSNFACQRAGAFRNVGGWGVVLGDEASGAWLGREAMRRALHSVDGLIPATPLLTAILDAEGGADAMVGRSLEAPPSAFARHAPAIVAAADAGDMAAAAILEEADAYVVRAIDTLQVPAPLPIVFLGGLGAVYERRLAGRYGALIRPAEGTSLDGALMLARRLGAAESEGREEVAGR